MRITLTRASAILLTALAFHSNADSLWFDIDEYDYDTDQPPTGHIVTTPATAGETPTEVGTATANFNAMAANARLLGADIEQLNAIIYNGEPEKLVPLPLPDGSTVEYLLTEAPVLTAELGLKYPSIKTLKGHERGNPDNYGHFDFTPQGFHALFYHDGETLLIDPQQRGNNRRYISYRKRDAMPLTRVQPEQVLAAVATWPPAQNLAFRFSSDNILRTYRLALSATGEYTSFHGGTRERALAAMATAVNRVNSVFERDLAIRLELVGNNDALIYTDPNADPFANNDTDVNKITEDQVRILGSDAFDIGHLLTTSGGGVAAVGVVCAGSQKGRGLTGSTRPTGDVFYIDLLAHEIGHQFGADHTFNGSTGACAGGNRAPGSAYEPGSGSTVMGYAGICGEENLQLRSDAYFHARSIEQVIGFVTTAGGARCGSRTALINRAPIADAGGDFIIPARTAFKLTGSATDSDSDALRYSWEQYDLGPASSSRATLVDDGERPIFRSWPPTSLPERYVPQLTDVVQGVTSVGEAYPTTTRELNFRLTVRDTRGGISHDDMTVSVSGEAGPFVVLEPDQGSRWTGNTQQRVRWEAAATNTSPIHCSAVEIGLSTDGGLRFPRLLAQDTPNDGEHWVRVPNLTSVHARVQVSCRDNIFFAISESDFEIVQSAAQPDNNTPIAHNDKLQVAAIGDRQHLIDVLANDSDEDAGDVLTIIEVNYAGAGQVQISDNNLLYTPASGFNGVEHIDYTIADQAGATASARVVITVGASRGNGGGAFSLPSQLLLMLLAVASQRRFWKTL